MRLRFLLPLPLWFAALAAHAVPVEPPGPLSPAQVPEALKPWIGWSLRGHEELLC